MTVVDQVRDENGWAFRDPIGKIPLGAPFESTDPVNGFHFLSEAYKATDPDYSARVTVPVLWDKQTKKMVNNSEDDICRMFNDGFRKFAKSEVDLFPRDLEPDHRRRHPPSGAVGCHGRGRPRGARDPDVHHEPRHARNR